MNDKFSGEGTVRNAIPFVARGWGDRIAQPRLNDAGHDHRAIVISGASPGK